MKKIILGSASPRRKDLLAALDLEFTVDTGNTFEEGPLQGIPAAEYPAAMARGKSHGFHRPLADDELLITADTAVICGNTLLGKPRDREDAVKMLRLLSGKTHEVVTGVTLRTSAREETFSVCTSVEFKELNAGEIDYYVDKYRPYDKAGAYGIQEWIGYIGISRIEGSFYNVMGFPVQRVYEELMKF